MAEETEHTEATSAPDAAAGDADPSHVPAGEPPPFPPTAAALASKAKDLEALRDAVVDAVSVGAGLWFSYQFVLFYLLIAVGRGESCREGTDGRTDQFRVFTATLQVGDNQLPKISV